MRGWMYSEVLDLGQTNSLQRGLHVELQQQEYDDEHAAEDEQSGESDSDPFVHGVIEHINDLCEANVRNVPERTQKQHIRPDCSRSAAV